MTASQASSIKFLYSGMRRVCGQKWSAVMSPFDPVLVANPLTPGFHPACKSPRCAMQRGLSMGENQFAAKQ
jgi:hypothetical protein